MADREVLRPYAKMLTAQVRSQAQYRSSFIMDMAVQTGFSAADFVTVVVLFGVTTALGGFSLVDVLVISGVSATGFALADLAVGNVERLKTYVRTGLLDAMLIRPRRVLPQLLVVDFQLRRVGRVVVSVTVLALALALAAAGVDWTWWRIALLVTVPVAGAVFFGAVFVMTASVAFWWIESGEFANAFTYGGRELSTYPINIYASFFRNVFAFGLGFGFVAYYPSLLILDRPDPLGLAGWAGLGVFPVAAAATGAAALVWRAGIRHYKGTGS